VSSSGVLDTGAKVTTVAMASTADIPGVLYSNASAGTYPIKLLGWVSASHADGTWNTIYSVNLTTGQINQGGSGQSAVVAQAGYIGRSAISGSFQTTGLSAVNVTTSSQNFATTDVSTGTDIITLTAHGLITGQPIQFTSSGTVPAGLTASTDYYTIKMSVDTIKVATTYNNAVAGTAIDLTSTGSGTHTCSPLLAFVLTTRGRPIFIGGYSYSGYIAAGSSGGGISTIAAGLQLYRTAQSGASGTGSNIAGFTLGFTGSAGSANWQTVVPSSSVSFIDVNLASGTYIYKMQMNAVTTGYSQWVSSALYGYELGAL
jgi:hypothetical protein